MNIVPAEIMDVLLIEPLVFEDDRGFFYESYNQKAFTEKLECQFISSKTNLALITTSCALHYQIQQPQGKLVRTIAEPSLTSLSICEQASTFGQSVSYHLSAENKRQLWIPRICPWSSPT